MPWELTIAGRRHRACLIGCAVLALLFFSQRAAPARADFGFKSLSSTFTDSNGAVGAQLAGSHPGSWSTTVAFNTTGSPGEESPDGAPKDLRITLPTGLVGATALLPKCDPLDLLAEACSPSTEVGSLSLELGGPVIVAPLYLLKPPAGQAARLGFLAEQTPGTIDLSISGKPPYNLIASITNVSQVAKLFGATLTLGGLADGRAFLTLPRGCGAPLRTTFAADSWQAPSLSVEAVAPEPQPVAGCSALSYSPSLEVEPTTGQAAAPSGLDVTLSAPDPGIESPSGRANADTERAVLQLPPGMTVNPPVAIGLAACDPAQLAAETPGGVPGDGCPQASKLGTAEVQTPLFDKPLAGAIYLARPDDPATGAAGAENPFDSLLALYLVVSDADRGVLLSLPIEIAADPVTGRLTASLDQLPQLPVSRLELHFNAGPRAPLTTPGGCGTQTIAYSLTPSSGNLPLKGGDTFATEGNCEPRFAPALDAGTSNPTAGRGSPFVLDLSQGSGEERLSRLDLTLPPGLSADFAAVPLCSGALAAADRCPAESKVGYARIAAGAGPTPLWVPDLSGPPGEVFLAGPYAGAPFSLEVVVPVKAGPFDLGTVVTRAAISVDPETAQASVRLDPLPQILSGIPIEYRDLRLVLDRPGFIRNPTSCIATAVHASVTSTTGTAAAASDRFQVGDCARLGFKPQVAVHLLGPVHRGAHPQLRAVLAPRPGDANLRRAAVTLPGTELLDSRHIRKVCARGEFAAGRCPAGAAYGRVRVWTPLLDEPLSGRVFLRESDGRLPDLAVALHGEVDLTLNGHIDSSHGHLRIVFPSLPDVPFSKVVLTMPGGRRGLLANTGGLCAASPRVSAAFAGQNGKHHEAPPFVKTDCPGRRH